MTCELNPSEVRDPLVVPVNQMRKGARSFKYVGHIRRDFDSGWLNTERYGYCEAVATINDPTSPDPLIATLLTAADAQGTGQAVVDTATLQDPPQESETVNLSGIIDNFVKLIVSGDQAADADPTLTLQGIELRFVYEEIPAGVRRILLAILEPAVPDGDAYNRNLPLVVSHFFDQDDDPDDTLVFCVTPATNYRGVPTTTRGDVADALSNYIGQSPNPAVANLLDGINTTAAGTLVASGSQTLSVTPNFAADVDIQVSLDEAD